MSRFLKVSIFGELIGILEESDEGTYSFQYVPSFVQKMNQKHKNGSISPKLMPMMEGIEYKNQYPRESAWSGLPGVLADALPDKFGNAIILKYYRDKYGADKYSYENDLSAFQKLVYIGNRSMGALEFEPAEDIQEDKYITEPLEIANLVSESRALIRGDLNVKSAEIMKIGASAGGARPKAVVAWNQDTNEVISGLVDVLPEGFSRWLIKFDAVTDKDENPGPFGMMEYAYSLMAKDCGINIPEVHAIKENGRTHFMIKRFDRDDDDRKLHMASLCGLMEKDFNVPGSASYEDLVTMAKTMDMSKENLEQIVKRMIFNVVLRNQDDHSKNFSFLMSRNFRWTLAPAYDLTYCHGAGYTKYHQMTVNGKVNLITLEDMESVATLAGIKRNDFLKMVNQIQKVAHHASAYFEKAGLMDKEHLDWIYFCKRVESDFVFFETPKIEKVKQKISAP